MAMPIMKLHVNAAEFSRIWDGVKTRAVDWIEHPVLGYGYFLAWDGRGNRILEGRYSKVWDSNMYGYDIAMPLDAAVWVQGLIAEVQRRMEEAENEDS